MRTCFGIIAPVLLAVAAVSAGFAVPADAQKHSGTRKHSVEHFRRGGFAGVEISSGMTPCPASSRNSRTLSGRGAPGNLMPDYAFGMFGGWRFGAQFAVAAGLEGSNSVVTGTTALPVFLRLRSDILDRRVSPMVQIDLGYAFQFPPSKRTESELSYNTEIFPERYTALGFGTPEEYVDACVENRLKQSDGLSEDEAENIAAKEREQAMNRLCRFPNGQRSYLPAEMLDALGSFSKDGFFACLSAGISIGTGGNKRSAGEGGSKGRIAVAAAVGVSQYSHGISLRTVGNGFIRMSVPSELPDGTPVIIARTSPGDNPLRLDLRLRLICEF